MIIRQVQLNESAQLAQLLRRAYQDVNTTGIYFAVATVDEQTVQQHLTHNIAYVLEHNGQFVSTVSLRLPWGHNPGPFGVPHIGWLATDPNYSKQGFAASLLLWLENKVLDEQFKLPAVTLGTAINHPWLIRFYQQQGFKPIATADLGLGHITLYFDKMIDDSRYQHWRNTRDQIIAQGFELNGKHIPIKGING